MVKKFLAFILCFLVLQIPLQTKLPTDEPAGNHKLEWAFKWAKRYYQEGRYREAVKKLELLLTYIDGETVDKDDEIRELPRKIRLLLGAANERMRKPALAVENYKQAQKLAAAGKGKAGIKDIDFKDLVQYQRIIMGNKNAPVEQVIEKEAAKPEKKKISPLLVIGGLLVAAGIVTLFLLKKKKSSEDKDAQADENYDTRVLGIEWRRIPAGDFMMGDNFNEGDPDEQPVHRVYLDEYYISKYEITFRQYDIFSRAYGIGSPPDEGWGRGQRPVIMITCESAQNFCTWLSSKTGKDIRLPTEAQWEKAARGPNQYRYPWGGDPPACYLANHCCMEGTNIVGECFRGASFYDIHDMAGNVAEWCRDWYDPFYYGNSPVNNPQGPSRAAAPPFYRVVRGGSWDCTSDLSIRSAARGRRICDSAGRFNDVGFRIVWQVNTTKN